MSTTINEHGIECVRSSTGRCFCHVYANRRKDGKRVRVNYGRPDFDEYYDADTREDVINDLVLVPIVCLDCVHYDSGEFGDFGELLAGPICIANVFFPTKTGKCKRKKK